MMMHGVSVYHACGTMHDFQGRLASYSSYHAYREISPGRVYYTYCVSTVHGGTKVMPCMREKGCHARIARSQLYESMDSMESMEFAVP